MERKPPIDRRDSPREQRRRFLKQMATGAVAGAAALPSLPTWGQEKSAAPAAPDVAAGQPPVAQTLARYAANLRYEDIPIEVVRQTKRYLIDSIGCGIGGFAAEPSRIANKLAAGVSAVRGEEKFRTLARRQLSAAQTDDLLRQLWELESLPQAGALVAATVV